MATRINGKQKSEYYKVSKIEIPTSSHPDFSGIQYMLKNGDLFGYLIEKRRITKEWKEKRYRICARCGKTKLRVRFTGDSKYCNGCLSHKKMVSPKRRREYRKIYESQGIGLQERCAKNVVYNMKKMGLIYREPCEICGKQETIAHHDSYYRPFSVRWLCKLHHDEWHKDNKPQYITEDKNDN